MLAGNIYFNTGKTSKHAAAHYRPVSADNRTRVMSPYGIGGGYGTNVKLVGPIVDGYRSVVAKYMRFLQRRCETADVILEIQSARALAHLQVDVSPIATHCLAIINQTQWKFSASK